MRSGRTVGWTGQIDWPPAPAAPRHGRHRKSAPGGTWTPAAPPRPDPLTDTSAGLRKFDLGMVPASVTPPATWRRAAWFAVASSAAALGGLLLATSALVGDSADVRGAAARDSPAVDPYYLSGDPTRPRARSTGWVQALSTPSHPQETRAVAGEYAGRPSISDPLILLATPDPETISRRTQQYYAAIGSGDLQSAFRMTIGQLRHEGVPAFAERYADVATLDLVEVRHVPARALCTLRLTRGDGAVLVQQRELRFTTGDQPRIHSDEVMP
ncbi:hypothetical protein [Saccharopolyspora taberi]|uniref:Uncharacterized protein n=1 Tax=Saccharopolyspora taberi TaxID=60895 RepID=A0ABN3VIH0_9PSEU